MEIEKKIIVSIALVVGCIAVILCACALAMTLALTYFVGIQDNQTNTEIVELYNETAITGLSFEKNGLSMTCNVTNETIDESFNFTDICSGALADKLQEELNDVRGKIK